MHKETKLTPEEAMQKLMKLCSAKEMCSFDIRKKLLQWGIDELKQGKILKHLATENFFSDRRYAEAFVNDRSTFQKWGKMKIRYALQAKKIQEDIIEESLDRLINEEYTDKLEEILNKKLRTFNESMTIHEKKARLYRLAVGRGFEPETVFRILNKIMGD